MLVTSNVNQSHSSSPPSCTSVVLTIAGSNPAMLFHFIVSSSHEFPSTSCTSSTLPEGELPLHKDSVALDTVDPAGISERLNLRYNLFMLVARESVSISDCKPCI